MKVIFVASSFAAVCLGRSSAGSYAQLDSVGFSKDGKLFAFSQSGNNAGTGKAWSSITVVDSAKNEWVKAPRKLESLGITLGNVGRHVVHHPMTDGSVKEHTVEFAEYAGSGSRIGNYLLTLQETEAKG